MGKIDTLIQKAISSPQNITFAELQKLCIYFKFYLQGTEGSHYVYARTVSPPHLISIQKCKKSAKRYQVKQLMDWVLDNGLYDDKTEKN